MIALAESPRPINADELADEKYPRELVAYHFAIMREGGLIAATIQPGDDDPYYLAYAVRMTWDGNDYLDSIRSESVWGKVKKALGEVAGSASLDTVKSIATMITVELAKKRLGM